MMSHPRTAPWSLWLPAVIICFGGLSAGAGGAVADEVPRPLSIVVMDPLAAPLACDCVQGYAQRDYDRLGAFLRKQLGRPVDVTYGEDLAMAIRLAPQGRADLIVGKRSLVEFDARECKLPARPIAALSGADGKTTFVGLFVVPHDDAARALADLKGYQVLFGPEDSAEKHAAALAALEGAGVAAPKNPEVRNGCAESALEALESTAKPGTAAVISSYAVALLEGCGTIDKGSLRVIGQTEPLPFITVFAAGLGDAETAAVRKSLAAVAGQPTLLRAIESKRGFVAIEEKEKAKK